MNCKVIFYEYYILFYLSVSNYTYSTHINTLCIQRKTAYIAFILVCNLWQGTFLYISIDRYHEFTWLLFDEILMLSLVNVSPYGIDIQHTVSQCKYCLSGLTTSSQYDVLHMSWLLSCFFCFLGGHVMKSVVLVCSCSPLSLCLKLFLSCFLLLPCLQAV